MSMRLEKGYQWPLFVIGLLVANTIGVAFLVVLSLSSDTHAVEPDYYKKALNWNQSMAQERENIRLGWKLELRLEEVAGDGRTRRRPPGIIAVTVEDRDGKKVPGVTLSVTAYSKLRANRRHTLHLRPRPDGSHVATVRFSPRGVWAFRIVAERGTERFTAQVERDAPLIIPGG